MALLFLFNHNVSDIFHTRDYYKKIEIIIKRYHSVVVSKIMQTYANLIQFNLLN